MASQLRPLSVDQAGNVLETLSLLSSENHKNSKLVIYETKLELESNSSTWRTYNSWSSSATSTVLYYAGYSYENVSRDISILPNLLERTYYVFTENSLGTEEKQKKLDLARRAKVGLQALIVNQYQRDLTKTSFVKQAKDSVDKIITRLEPSSKSVNVDPELEQIHEKDQKISQSESEIAQLKEANKALQSTVDSITELKQNFKQHIDKQKEEITRLQGVILSESLNTSVDPNTVSAKVLTERIKVMADALSKKNNH
ncbi:MAG TPA: hypothetical protein VFU89_00485 [Rhabdochlamydiaceae bacterium]|nr:hypothetical protein [Rhabdochlamydiaceae bacterium]